MPRTFDISIECNSAAFDGPDCGPELARILRQLADSLEESEAMEAGARYYANLRDVNGNRCGTAEMVTE